MTTTQSAYPIDPKGGGLPGGEVFGRYLDALGRLTTVHGFSAADVRLLQADHEGTWRKRWQPLVIAVDAIGSHGPVRFTPDRLRAWARALAGAGWTMGTLDTAGLIAANVQQYLDAADGDHDLALAAFMADLDLPELIGLVTAGDTSTDAIRTLAALNA